ncbi:MAG: NAD(P)H-hydrate dehydratase [Lentilitoribacter sp.]
MMHELLTPEQMSTADALMIKSGIVGIELMKCAGAFVFDVLRQHFPNAKTVLVVAGVGNNGGDGFILAELLKKNGYDVAVTIIGDDTKIAGDARLAFDTISQGIQLIKNPDLEVYDLIVDGIFGAGLKREVKGDFADIIHAINASATDVLAIDLPSGINGQTGQVSGCAIKAQATATFFRYKPGHVLFPGRELSGKVYLGQFGITQKVLGQISPRLNLNTPALWQDHYPILKATGHKYSRGHALSVSGGLDKSGAARLMAKAALRMGAGLVTIACPSETMSAHAARTDAIMLTKMDNEDELSNILDDKRINAVCVGPGLDPNEQTRSFVKIILNTDKSVVLDAGALSAFSDKPSTLCGLIRTRSSPTILTPHDGEFERLFPELISTQDKVKRTKVASETSSATVVLKGPDTVIAKSSDNAAITNNAPPWLATAGSGDVLCGLIAALLAQGMPEFEAACTGVWFHGEAGTQAGPGIISSELEKALKTVIENVYQEGFD